MARKAKKMAAQIEALGGKPLVGHRVPLLEHAVERRRRLIGELLLEARERPHLVSTSRSGLCQRLARHQATRAPEQRQHEVSREDRDGGVGGTPGKRLQEVVAKLSTNDPPDSRFRDTDPDGEPDTDPVASSRESVPVPPSENWSRKWCRAAVNERAERDRRPPAPRGTRATPRPRVAARPRGPIPRGLGRPARCDLGTPPRRRRAGRSRRGRKVAAPRARGRPRGRPHPFAAAATRTPGRRPRQWREWRRAESRGASILRVRPAIPCGGGANFVRQCLTPPDEVRAARGTS